MSTTGTLMFGATDPSIGGEVPNAGLGPGVELCRLAIPRRVYTQSHIEFVLEVAGIVAGRKDQLCGFRIVQEPPFLRHFSAILEPVEGS